MDIDLWSPRLVAGFSAGEDSEFPPSRDAMLARLCRAKRLGAGILATPTGHASQMLLKQAGLEGQMEEINAALTQLTRQAAGSDGLVAGTLAPAGLELEPFGETSFTELMAVYRSQGSCLAKAGADCFLVETSSALQYARCAVLALRKLKLPILASVRLERDGELQHGGSALNALTVLQALGVSAFGLRGEYDREELEELVAQLAQMARVPLMVQPAKYRMEGEDLCPLTQGELEAHCRRLLELGATLLYCATGGERLAVPAGAVKEYGETGPRHYPAQSDPDQVVLADAWEIYDMDYDRLELGPPLPCTADMSEVLMQQQLGGFDVVRIEINSPEDAQDFAQNEYMAHLPVCFLSHDEISLKLALMLYNGIALVDSQSSLPRKTLEKIAAKYGAIVY